MIITIITLNMTTMMSMKMRMGRVWVDGHQMVTKQGGGGGQTTVPILALSLLLDEPCFNTLKCKEIVHCCKVRPTLPYSLLSIHSDAMHWQIVHCCIVIQTFPHSGPTLSNAVKCTVCIVIIPFPYTDPIISNALKSTVLWSCVLQCATLSTKERSTIIWEAR